MRATGRSPAPGKSRAQRVVPAHDLGQAPLERGDVQRPLQPIGKGQVELGQSRQCPARSSACAPAGWTPAGGHLFRTRAISSAGSFDCVSRASSDPPGQRLDRRRFEERPERQRHPEGIRRPEQVPGPPEANDRPSRRNCQRRRFSRPRVNPPRCLARTSSVVLRGATNSLPATLSLGGSPPARDDRPCHEPSVACARGRRSPRGSCRPEALVLRKSRSSLTFGCRRLAATMCAISRASPPMSSRASTTAAWTSGCSTRTCSISSSSIL